jgi:hypothetical protein
MEFLVRLRVQQIIQREVFVPATVRVSGTFPDGILTGRTAPAAESALLALDVIFPAFDRP